MERITLSMEDSEVFLIPLEMPLERGVYGI